MKGLGKRIFGLCADTFGLNKRMQGPQALVLRLHRVVPESVLEKLRFQRHHALSEEGLEHLLAFLQRQYTLLQLDDYLALEPTRIPRRERFACLTFDDGWQDNFHYALPILKARRAPASIYLAAGFTGTDKQFWWQTLGDAFAEGLRHPDKETLLRAQVTALQPDAPVFANVDAFLTFIYTLSAQQREALAAAVAPLSESSTCTGLNWEQVKHMSESGLFRFGVQSYSHLPLPLQNEADAHTDIQRSREIVLQHPEARFNQLFCYPHGAYNEATMAMVAAAGFTGALSNFACYASRHARERFRLPRLNVTEALARDPALFNYLLLKAGTQRGRYIGSRKLTPAPTAP